MKYLEKIRNIFNKDKLIMKYLEKIKNISGSKGCLLTTRNDNGDCNIMICGNFTAENIYDTLLQTIDQLTGKILEHQKMNERFDRAMNSLKKIIEEKEKQKIALEQKKNNGHN